MSLGPEAQSIPIEIIAPGFPECQGCPVVNGNRKTILNSAKHRGVSISNRAEGRNFPPLGKFVRVERIRPTVECKRPRINRLLHPRSTFVDVNVNFVADVRFGTENTGLIFPQYAGDNLKLGYFNCPYLQRRSH